MRWRTGLVLLVSAVMLAACGKKTPQATDEAHLGAPAEGQGAGAMSPYDSSQLNNEQGSNGFSQWGDSGWSDQGATQNQRRVVYFQLDSSVIDPPFMAVIRDVANHLLRNPSSRVVVEGHCDERGSQEYNLALGQRRAEAIKGVLMAEGVASEQVETVSYGEERPAEPGHDEIAWAKNRRAELAF